MRRLCMAMALAVLGFAVPASAQWTRVTELPSIEMLSFIIHDDVMYAGANGIVYFSADSGRSWDSTARIPDTTTEVSAMAIFDGKLYVGSFGKGVHVSADTGKSWQGLNGGLTAYGADLITAMETRGDSIYLGTSGAGIYVLPKGGTTWSSFNDGLSWNYSYEILSINSVGDRLFAGAGVSATYYVNDRDTSGWRELVLGPMPPLGLGLLDVVSIGGNVFAGGSDGLYLSRNNGESFEAYHPSAAYISDAHATVSDTNVYIALSYSGGTANYTNGISGNEWVFQGVQTGVLTFDLEAFNGRLYAARLDGLWMKPLIPTPVESDPDQSLPIRVGLAQNYPNPFNASTVISYQLAQGSRVDLDVVNTNGQVVRHLVDDHKPAGQHRVIWDGTTHEGEVAASGIYFYRLVADDHELSRKMLLLK